MKRSITVKLLIVCAILGTIPHALSASRKDAMKERLQAKLNAAQAAPLPDILNPQKIKDLISHGMIKDAMPQMKSLHDSAKKGLALLRKSGTPNEMAERNLRECELIIKMYETAQLAKSQPADASKLRALGAQQFFTTHEHGSSAAAQAAATTELDGSASSQASSSSSNVGNIAQDDQELLDKGAIDAMLNSAAANDENFVQVLQAEAQSSSKEIDDKKASQESSQHIKPLEQMGPDVIKYNTGFNNACGTWAFVINNFSENKELKKFAAHIMRCTFKSLIHSLKRAKVPRKNVLSYINMISYKGCMVSSLEQLKWDEEAYVKNLFEQTSDAMNPQYALQERIKKKILMFNPECVLSELLKNGTTMVALASRHCSEDEIINESLKLDALSKSSVVMQIMQSEMKTYESQVSALFHALKKMNAIDAVDESGFPLLFYAAFNSYPQSEAFSCILEIFMKLGANPNIRDAKGRIALMFTIDPKIKRLLRQHGASVNFKDENGETALHTACRAGAVDVVEALLAENIDFKIKNAMNKTAYEVATHEVKSFLDSHPRVGKYERNRHVELKAFINNQQAHQIKQKMEEHAKIEKDKELAAKLAKDAQEEQAKKQKHALDKAKGKKDRRKAREQQELQDRFDSLTNDAAITFNADISNDMIESIKDIYGKLEHEKRVANKREAAQIIFPRLLVKKQRHAFNAMRAFAKAESEKERAKTQKEDLSIRLHALENGIKLVKTAIDLDRVTQQEIIAPKQLNLIESCKRVVTWFVDQEIIKPKEVVEKMAQIVLVGAESSENSKKTIYDAMHEAFNALDKPIAGCLDSVGFYEFIAGLLGQIARRQSSAEENLIEKLFDAIRAGDSQAFKEAIQMRANAYKQAPLRCAQINGFFVSDILALQKKKREADMAALKARNSASSSGAVVALSASAKK